MEASVWGERGANLRARNLDLIMNLIIIRRPALCQY